MTFRFVHTADLHLDPPLISLALRDPDLAAEVGVASRTALTRIVDLCLAFRVARDLDQLRQEGVATAEGMAGLWIDKVETRRWPRFTSGGPHQSSNEGRRSKDVHSNFDGWRIGAKPLNITPDEPKPQLAQTLNWPKCSDDGQCLFLGIENPPTCSLATSGRTTSMGEVHNDIATALIYGITGLQLRGLTVFCHSGR